MKYTPKLLVFTYFLSAISLFLSCNNDKKLSEEDANYAALPHTKGLQHENLSIEDLKKLGKAKGKTAVIISLDQMKTEIRNAFNQLHIFLFIDYKEASSVNQIINITKKLEHFDKNLKIVIFQMKKPENMDDFNIWVRTNNIVPEVKIIDKLTDKWYQQINMLWNGQLPGIYFKNNSDKTDVFYSGNLSENELEAILPSFL